MTTKLTSNYPGYSANDIPTNQKFITLRTAQDDPMSWVEFDNNFELLRYSVNSLVDDIAVVREDVDYGAEIAVINENIQSNYSTLDAKFNDYLTLTAGDARYATPSDIVDAYTKAEVDTNFATQTELTDYVTGAELTTFGASYALLSDVATTGQTTLAGTLEVLEAGDSVTISDDATFDVVANAETIISKVASDKMVFDYSDGALRVYDFNPSIPSVSSDDRHTLQLQRHTDRGNFGAASQPVGVSGQVNTCLNAKAIVGPNVKSNEWAILGVVENFPNPSSGFAHAESEHVGGYFQGKRHGSGGKTWGATIEAWDLADSYADVLVGSCVTLELDMTANFDAGANRVIVDTVLRKTNESLDRPGVIAGMRMRDNHEDGSGGFFYNGYEFKGATKISAFSAEVVGDNSDDGANPWGNTAYRALGTTYAHFQSQGTPTFSFRDTSNAAIGIGLDEATYSSAAIRIGADQKFAMEATGVVFMKYSAENTAIELHGDGGLKHSFFTGKTLKVAGGPFGDAPNSLDSDFEAIASHNVLVLRRMIKQAILDQDTINTEAQYPEGEIVLPAGRIYLNEKIEITLPGTLGHNQINSLVIKGKGDGVTHLCWTNSSASRGLQVNLGPYGAMTTQKLTVKGITFVTGHMGNYDWGQPATTVENGNIGMSGVALHVSGDRAEITNSSGATNLEGVDKFNGFRASNNLLIQDCTFQGWLQQHAGWDKCLLVEDVTGTIIENCSFICYTDTVAGGQQQWWQGTGIHMTGDAKCTDYYVDKCRFLGFEYAVKCDGNIEGVTIHQSSWIHGRHGIWWYPTKMSGGTAYFDGSRDPMVTESVDGTATDAYIQWPLMVVTDCHINCCENNIYVQNGWQVMIKGNSFYGVANAQIDGVSTVPPGLIHRSVYLDDGCSNCLIVGNVFSDQIWDVGGTQNINTAGGMGPSIEVKGHCNLINSNTFGIDPSVIVVGSDDGDADNIDAGGNQPDEPHVLLAAYASGNMVKNNLVITGLYESYIGTGIPLSNWNSNLTMYVEDNNTGTYNGVSIVPNIISGNS